jgi:hypothetical protein
MAIAWSDCAHAAEWLLSCSGTKKDITNDFQAEQLPGFLISVDWSADMVVLQDAPQLPALVVMIARPDFVEARGFFVDGATPKEVRLTSHMGTPAAADWKTSIVIARPGDLNRVNSAAQTRTSQLVRILTYSSLDLVCRLEHLSQ